MKVIERFIAIYFIFFIAISVLMGYVFVNNRKLEISKIDIVLLEAATKINGELKNGFHSIAVSKDSITKEEHNRNSEKLTTLRKKYDLIYLYSAVEIGDRVYLTSTSTTDIDIKNGTAAGYFYHYDDASSDLRKAIENNITIFLEYKDKEGKYRAVFIPMKAENGKRYLLAAEKDMKEIDTMILWTSIKIMMITLFMFVLLSILLLGYIKKSENKKAEIERINKELEKKYLIKYKEVEDAKEKLVEINNTKDKLFPLISHDLKGPIGNLLSIAEFMAENEDTIDAKNRKEIFDSIRKSVEGAYFLANNLFEWAKIQRNGLEISKVNIKFRYLFDSLLTYFKLKLAEKKLKLEISGDVEIEIYADIKNIDLILKNLISNSIKFSSENDVVEIGVKKINDEILVYVKDNGEGIKKEKLENIFNMYENKFTYGTKGERGAGIGIILCKELAEKNGARIEVESEEGKGTEFRIYFQVNKNNE